MRIARRRAPHPAISLVSTSDVAFLLLIFFLSTAALNVERGLLLELPRSNQPPTDVPADRVVTIDVAADGSVRLDGGTLPAEGVRAALLERRRTEPGLVVRLRVAPAASYAAFVGVLDQVKLSGARQLSLEQAAPTAGEPS